MAGEDDWVPRLELPDGATITFAPERPLVMPPLRMSDFKKAWMGLDTRLTPDAGEFLRPLRENFKSWEGLIEVCPCLPDFKVLTITRKRPWRERLFSWPWRPWQAVATMEAVVPTDECYLVNFDPEFGLSMAGSRGTRLLISAATFRQLGVGIARESWRR